MATEKVIDDLVKDFWEKVTVDQRQPDGKYRFGYWRSHVSKDPQRAGKIFYENYKTKEVSWTDPSTFTNVVLTKYQKRLRDAEQQLDQLNKLIRTKLESLAKAKLPVQLSDVSTTLLARVLDLCQFFHKSPVLQCTLCFAYLLTPWARSKLCLMMA